MISVIKIIGIILGNLPTIIKLIKELLDLIGQLSGQQGRDEEGVVSQVKEVAKELGKKTGIGMPPDLKMD